MFVLFIFFVFNDRFCYKNILVILGILIINSIRYFWVYLIKIFKKSYVFKKYKDYLKKILKYKVKI